MKDFILRYKVNFSRELINLAFNGNCEGFLNVYYYLSK